MWTRYACRVIASPFICLGTLCFMAAELILDKGDPWYTALSTKEPKDG
jgi:hypothetical protein